MTVSVSYTHLDVYKRQGKTDRNKALIEMQEKYDQQKIINENNLSQIKKDRIIRNVLIALTVSYTHLRHQ